MDNDYKQLTIVQGYRKEYLCDSEQKTNRVVICKDCEHYQTAGGMCKKCLCIVNLKSWLKKEKCPIGKW